MSVAAGSRLGPYEIVAPLGAGGMGEVFRARDTKLGRDVALKILPASVVDDPDRVARFKREAQVLAALNHPHIAAIYGFDEVGATPFLVMELVAGETLADRLKRGPIPIDEAIAIARQIADALQEAHEKGIIHRDLKPANIALSGTDQVKVLDFGLAKLAASPAVAGTSSLSMSPTLTTPAMMTGVGMILGTAAYMAPEQAKGRDADKRCDVWAFGCVVYEMLTAKRAFEGEDITDTIAAIMRGEPDWSALPADTPTNVRTLVKRCLKKHRQERIADIAVAQFLLDEPAPLATVNGAAPPTARASSRSLWVAWACCAGLAVTTLPFVATHLREQPPQPRPVRFSIATPPARQQPNQIAISPDGRLLTFVGYDKPGTLSLWLRRLDGSTVQPIAGTNNGTFPFWSPDSRFIGFGVGGQLKKINVSGGPPQVICSLADGVLNGATWNGDGVILFASSSGIHSISSAGGTPALVIKADAARGTLRDPQFLPDGRHFLFVSVGQTAGIHVGSLDSTTTSLLVQSPTRAEYASGHLLFVRDGTLMAQAFDAPRLQLAGDAFLVAERVSAGNVAGFSVSQTGVLAYREQAEAAGGESTLVWYDRAGKELSAVGGAGQYRDPALSPDGKRLAVSLRDPQANTDDVWVVDLAGGTWSRLTFDPGNEWEPIWSPDGARIAFASDRDGVRRLGTKIYWKPSNGAGADELVFKSTEGVRLDDWSRDGKFLLITERQNTVSVVPLTGEHTLQPLIRLNSFSRDARFSPDTRWIAYTSTESGNAEVYVQSFPVSGGKWQVSTHGGADPMWRSDGRELFFVSNDGEIVAVPVNAAATFERGTARTLFRARIGGPPNIHHYAVARDGQQFLIVSGASGPEASPPIAVVVDWMHSVTK